MGFLSFFVLIASLAVFTVEPCLVHLIVQLLTGLFGSVSVIPVVTATSFTSGIAKQRNQLDFAKSTLFREISL